MFKPLQIVPLMLLVVGSALSQAPIQSADTQQAVIFQQITTRKQFNNDGTGTRTAETRVKVLSPAGVQALGQLAFGYNSESEQLTIDYVRVRKPSGQVVATSIENAPEASLQIAPDAPMYTDFRQKHISVAALAPGDILEYKTTVKLAHPLAPDQFWMSYSFEKTAQVENEILIIEVPKNRDIKLKSSRKYTTQESATARTYTWESSNQAKADSAKPDTKKVQEDTAPDVQLSTFRSWHEVAAWYEQLLAPRISVTPEIKARMLELTKGTATEEEKARQLYSFVSQNIRYVSLSFGVGRYQPHAAADVLRDGYGDCKDKHALLAALLMSAGIKSSAVLIHSQNDLEPDVPAPSQFDHVITQADIAGKKVFLDSTVGVNPFGFLVSPLRGKKGLLIAPDLPDPLVDIPAAAPMASTQELKETGSFDEAGNLEADISISSQGDLAFLLRLAARQTPQAQWQNLVQRFSYLAGFAGDVSKVQIENVESPELPLKISYHYSRKTYFSADDRDQSLARNTLPLPRLAPGADVVDGLKHHDQIRLNGPIRLTQALRLHFTKDQHPVVPIPVSVKRDYANYSSLYELKGDDLTVTRTYDVDPWALPVSRENDVEAFLRAIGQDADQQLAIKLSPGSVESVTVDSTDAVKLNEAAEARLNVNDFKGAEEFALKAVKADPKSQYAWNNLGRAYLGERDQLDKAEQAFRKQIEINAYDEYAYNNLGQTLRREHRTDEAIAAFRKQIEIVPLDKWAHKNLGDTLFTLKKYDESIPELQKALQITPDDTQLKVTLAMAYKNIGEKDKSQALLSTLQGKNLTPPGFDIYKVAIDTNVDPEEMWSTAYKALKDVETSFQLNEAADRGSATASVVAAMWAKIGSAYLGKNNLENAERYLSAAWIMSQSAVIARRLAQVYEKENKKALAISTDAEGAVAEGDRQGLRDDLTRLVGDAVKADAMIAASRAKLSRERTLVLSKNPAKSGSANLLLVFANSAKPQKVTFTEGMPALVDRYESEIKSKDFPIKYPDDVPQHVVRAGVLYCGMSGCSVVLVPPSARPSISFPATALHQQSSE